MNDVIRCIFQRLMKGMNIFPDFADAQPTMLRFRTLGTLCIVFFGLSLAAAFGQNLTGQISGVVKDPSGAVIPNATVTVTNTDQNLVVRTLKTGKQGQFTVPLLAIGEYSVEVQAKGFKSQTVSAVEVNVNLTSNVPLTMKPGAATQTVHVRANQLAPQLNSAAAGTLIGTRELTQLSLANRNYLDVLYMQPGISSGVPGPDVRGNVTASGGINAQNFHINGLSAHQNRFYLDGQDEVKRLGQETVTFPGIGFIRQVNLQRGSYGAQYAGPGGGVINVETKSGTTRFHGGLYEFYRSQAMDANNYFNNLVGRPRPILRDNDYGFELGGPVWIPHLTRRRTTRTFFFIGNEFLRREKPTTHVISNIPTAAQRQGIFNAPVCVAYNKKGSKCTKSATTIQNIDPTAQAYLNDIISKVPLPDNPNDPQGLIESLPAIHNATQTIIRIDHQFSPKLSVFFRYLDEPTHLVSPQGFLGGSDIPGISTDRIAAGSTSYLGHLTYVVNASNVLSFGFGYRPNWVTTQPIGLMLKSENPDINPTLPYPTTSIEVPTVIINGSNYRAINAYRARNPVTQIFTNGDSTVGRNSLLYGFNLEFEKSGSNRPLSNSGIFHFGLTPRPKGSKATRFDQAFANFLLGDVSKFTQDSASISSAIHSNIYEGYLQDNFRASSRLMLNIGARYSYVAVPSEGDLSGYPFFPISNFDPARFNSADAPAIDSKGLICTKAPCAGGATPNPAYKPLNGIIISGKNSPYGSKVNQQPVLTLAPRFGFAYDLFGNGRSALRGGYGVYYLEPQTNQFKSAMVYNNPPNIGSITISSTSFDDPGVGTSKVNRSPQTINGYQVSAPEPYLEVWSLDVQKMIGNSMLLDVGYYAYHAVHMQGTEEINQPRPGAYVKAGIIPGNVVTGSNTQRLNQIRPYLGYAAINAVEDIFGGNYNSLQVSLRKRVRRGLFFGANYTYSKALRDTGSPQNIYNPQADYGTDRANRTNVFNFHAIYPLPFLRDERGTIGHVLGGWSVAAVFFAGSGTFLTANTVGVDPGGLGLLDGSAAGRPDYISNPNTNAPHQLHDWFNKSAFAQVPAGQYRPGNDGVSNILGPGYEKWNLSVFKTFKLYHHLRMQLRAASFNTFNHTNLTGINTQLGNGNYDQATSAAQARTMQLAAKINF